MTSQSHITKEQEQQILMLLDGQLGVSESELLAEQMKHDEDLRDVYMRFAKMHAMLKWCHGYDSQEVFDSQQIMGEIDSIVVAELLAEEELVAQRIAAKEAAERVRCELLAAAELRRKIEELNRKNLGRPQPIVIPLSVAYLAVAAAIVIAVFTINSLVVRNDVAKNDVAKNDVVNVVLVPQPITQPEPTVPRAGTIASITNSQSARWRDPDFSLLPDARLTTGLMMLEEGVVEITFDSGAQIIAEAPLEFELLSTNQIRVMRGKLLAKVPEEAIGFAVITDASVIVDLGTEFGVDINDTGDVGVHVLDGEVVLVPDRGLLLDRDGVDAGKMDIGENYPAKVPIPRETLVAGNAQQVSADGRFVKEIEFDKAAFFREVPESPYELAILKSRPVAFWPLNEAADLKQVASLGRIEASGAVGHGVTLGQSDSQSGPGSGAVTFSGEHDGINIGYHEDLALTDNFTIEAWVRTPPYVDGPQRIVSSYNVAAARTGFGFGIANGPHITGRNDRPSMVLCFTFFSVYDCISCVELVPDSWVHVAAVIDDVGRPMLFMNGQAVPVELRSLVTSSGNATFGPLPETWSEELGGIRSPSAFYLGRNPRTALAVPLETWQGGIGNLAVFDRILTGKEVLEHYKAGLVKTDLVLSDSPRRLQP